MTITSAITSASANAADTRSTQGLKKLSSDYNSFIKLLTTQLQHQDPTNPTDTSEFTNQIVGFSQVEQQVNINSNLEKMLQLQKSTSVGNSVSYIDKFVQAETDSFNLGGSKTVLSYNLPEAAESATVKVLDKSGNQIVSFVGGKLAGNNTIPWDGKDLDGKVLDSSEFTFEVIAKNSDGANLTATSLESTKQGGTALLSYNLSKPAQAAKISITDKTGVVLASFDGKTLQGENKIEWDGKDLNGNVLPDGEYKLSVKATDDKGADLDAKTYVTDLVTQVDLHGDSTIVYLQKIPVDLSKVLSIKSQYAKI